MFVTALGCCSKLVHKEEQEGKNEGHSWKGCVFATVGPNSRYRAKRAHLLCHCPSKQWCVEPDHGEIPNIPILIYHGILSVMCVSGPTAMPDSDLGPAD